MKYFTLLFFFLFSVFISANKIEITDINQGQVEGTAQLVQKSVYDDVLLDCNSFVHGFYLDRSFFILDSSDCYQIYDSLKDWTSAGNKGCLDLNIQTKGWTLTKGHDSCR